MAGFNAMMGVQTQAHTIAVQEVMPQLPAMQQAAIDPFGQTPVQWTAVGLSDVDQFSRSTALVYGRALVLQQTLTQATSWRANPSLTVAGYRDANELIVIAQQLATSTPGEVTNLLSTGQSLVTNVPAMAQSNPALMPVATSEVQAGISRLNATQELLRAQTPRLQSLVTGR